jgi:AcrR family transcriptional regulator
VESPDKKREILKAAGDCFARYGYEKTTLDDIGKLVSLNKASLYYYYKNKESIYTEVIALESERFFNTLKAKINKITGCKNQIITYLVERLNYIRHTVNLHELSIETKQKFAPFFKNLLELFFEREVSIMGEFLANGIKKGELINCDTKKVAGSIITVADALKHKAAQCGHSLNITQIDYSKIVEELKFTITLILDGLKK